MKPQLCLTHGRYYTAGCEGCRAYRRIQSQNRRETDTQTPTRASRRGHYISNAAEIPDMPWASQGLCVGMDGNIFFPVSGAPGSNKEAKAICRDCPVRSECRTHGLKYETDGIWGGLSESERPKVRIQQGMRTA